MSPAAPDPAAARAALAVLERSLAAVLADGVGLAQLTRAQAAVGFLVDGSDGALVLRLDGERPRLSNAGEEASITVRLSAEQTLRMARGRLSLTTAVLSDEVSTDGPVRRYLEVEPILRRALARAADEEGVDGPEYEADFRAPIPADLLAIETRNLHKSFGSYRVLQGVDLAVPEGVISVLLGPSGVGKSLLLRHILGLLEPDVGEVIIRGRALSELTAPDARRAVEGGLARAAQVVPVRLGGDPRMRPGLFRALALESTILLCDHLDAGLDPVHTTQMGDLLIERHRRHGGTMLVCTQSLMLARRVAEHVSLLWKGEVISSGTLDQVLASEHAVVEQFVADEALRRRRSGGPQRRVGPAAGRRTAPPRPPESPLGPRSPGTDPVDGAAEPARV